MPPLHAVAAFRHVGIARSKKSEQGGGCTRSARRDRSACNKCGHDLDRLRQRPQHINARQAHQLAQLLKAKLDFSGPQPASRPGRRGCLNQPRAKLLPDAPALEQLKQLHAARAGRVTDALSVEHGLPDRRFRADPWPRRTSPNRHRDAGMRQVDPTVARPPCRPRSSCRSRWLPIQPRRTPHRPARAWQHRRRRPIRRSLGCRNAAQTAPPDRPRQRARCMEEINFSVVAIWARLRSVVSAMALDKGGTRNRSAPAADPGAANVRNGAASQVRRSAQPLQSIRSAPSCRSDRRCPAAPAPGSGCWQQRHDGAAFETRIEPDVVPAPERGLGIVVGIWPTRHAAHGQR